MLLLQPQPNCSKTAHPPYPLTSPPSSPLPADTAEDKKGLLSKSVPLSPNPHFSTRRWMSWAHGVSRGCS